MFIFRNRDGNSGLNGKCKRFILPGLFFNLGPPEWAAGPAKTGVPGQVIIFRVKIFIENQCIARVLPKYFPFFLDDAYTYSYLRSP